jgi:hypothetical protein
MIPIKKIPATAIPVIINTCWMSLPRTSTGLDGRGVGVLSGSGVEEGGKRGSSPEISVGEPGWRVSIGV